MSLIQVYHVARREYLARVRSKWFIISTLMVPLIFAGWAGVRPLLARTDVTLLRIAVVDVGTGRGDDVVTLLEEIEDFPVEVAEAISVDARDLDDVRARLHGPILDKELDAYVVLSPDDELGIRGRYYARETGNPVIVSRIEGAVRASALTAYLAGTGVDRARVEALTRWDLESVQISARGEEAGGFLRAYFTAFAFAMLVYMSVLIGGQQLGTSIVEEKSSRLIELVLGAMTPTEFMAGKVFGNVAASLTQLAAWIGLAMIAGLYVLPALALTDLDLGGIFDPVRLFYFAIFFLLGFLFYSVLFAMVAATCTNLEEFQQAATPVTMTVVMSLMFIFYAITNPSSMVTRVLSFVPPITPLVMVARVNVLMPPMWEVWATILFLAGASLGAMWFAGKVFRFALLMQGKRPDLRTVLRLARAA